MSFRKNKMRINSDSSRKPRLDEVPDQFCDYMRSVNTRFEDICELYLKGLSMDDIKYLAPEDLINLVPETQYRHKLLMTIMVRRYLYRPVDEDDLCYIPPAKTDDVEYKCDKCCHSCYTQNCNHACADNK